MRKVLLVVLAAALVLTGFVGCSTKPAASNKAIKIGMSMPLTGAVALNGEQISKGAKLAIKQQNAKGGINGRQIELVLQDDRSDPKEGANIANMFAQDADVVAVICNANSSVYLAAAPIYNKATLPSISPDCSSPLLTNAGPYINRITLSDALQGKKEAEFVWEDGYKKVGMFFENSDFGRGVYGAFDNRFKELGGTLLTAQSAVLGESKDFSPIITIFRNLGCEAIAIGANYTESALLIKQMKNADFNVPAYGTQGLFTPSFIKIGGEGVEGTFTHGGVTLEAPTPQLLQFQKDYEAEYKVTGEIGKYSSEGYDVANIFIEALLKVGPDRVKIGDYVRNQMTTFVGAQTTYTFLHNGDVDFTLHRFIVKDGQFKLYVPPTK